MKHSLQAALQEFSGKPSNYMCVWKPVAMEKLCALGLTKPWWMFGTIRGYTITRAGIAALALLKAEK